MALVLQINLVNNLLTRPNIKINNRVIVLMNQLFKV